MKFKVFRFKKVNSTNNTAIRIIKISKFDYGMIISETQNSGRGQYGKKWISYKGNLFVSFFYKLENLTLSLSQLTKINCLLVKKLLSLYYKKKIIFKKPNDLLIDKKKICGILQETISKLNRRYLIVGIGINLRKNPKIKNYPTTNLYDLINKNVQKKKIENELKKIFETKLTKFYKSKKIN
jgi:BirA family biotin operon repressor/biotin-[acetyl-CoA-carboxylase] ligase